jgi:FMN-dependent NADH-azoreductase
MLKHYIDLIVQPEYLFRYGEHGKVEGLVQGKKMVVITSRGGQYSGNAKGFDFQEPYLRAIFNFVGILDIDFIVAEPMDMGQQTRNRKIEEAKQKCQEIYP